MYVCCMTHKLFRLLFCLLPPLFVGYIGGLFTRSSVEIWYQELSKSPLTPPDEVFFPVWTTLYLLMGLSCYLLVEKKQFGPLNFSLYSLQLLLNLSWTYLFFYLQSPTLGLVDICLLWFVIGMMIRSFIHSNKAAGFLQIPYFLWVTFAAYLNFEIWRLNYAG